MPFSRICAAGAGLTLVITIVAIGIAAANRSLTHEAAVRQQLINQAVTWSQINMRLATALTTVAEHDNDERIRKLLEEHGITLRTRGNAPKAPAPPAGKTK